MILNEAQMADILEDTVCGREDKMHITVLTVGPVQTNCYIASAEESKSCVVIDPGEEPDKIADYMDREGMQCLGILITHGHFDHITGVKGLVKRTGAPVYAYEGEKELMENPALNGSRLVGYELSVKPDVLLKDGQNLEIGGLAFEVIHTPGHTVGGCCFYEKSSAVLFSGDTIFMESIGRTDFPTGSSKQLLASVREKVLVLPEDVRIYPGHGEETTVENEKKYNPYA